MMNAATAALVDAAPVMYTEQIVAYSATSGLLTAVTGVYVEMFLSLPLANWYYRREPGDRGTSEEIIQSSTGQGGLGR